MTDSESPRRERRRKGSKRGRKRWQKLLSRYTGYYLLRIIHAVISRLPLAVGLVLSRWFGTLAYCLAWRERGVALENLRRVYGEEWSDAQLRRCAREVFQHTAATVIEWVILRRWSNEKLLAKYPEAIADIQTLAQRVRDTDLRVGITAHLGSWEILGVLFHRFAPGVLVPIAQKSHFEKYQSFFHRLRTEQGMEVIYNDATRSMFRAVRSGQLLGFLSDQSIRTNSGVFVEFFGKPAYTATFPVDFARREKNQMFCASLVREAGSLHSTKHHRYRFLYSENFDVPRTDDEERDVFAATEHWTQVIEGYIREYPSQWSWMHRRWRQEPGRPRLHHGAWRALDSEASESSASPTDPDTRSPPLSPTAKGRR